MKTANGVELKQIGGLSLLPCAADVCQECAVKHPLGQPHNQQSLYYQYSFFAANGRWPTWADAMAHCSDAVKAQWTDALAAHGVIFGAASETKG